LNDRSAGHTGSTTHVERTLYATTEDGRNAPFHVNNDPQDPLEEYGTLSVISVAKAESQPRDAVISTVAAGCNTRRVAVSPDGTTIWTTAALSNQLLAFSSKKLVEDPNHALLAAIRVGTEPYGVTTFDNGQRIAVADASASTGAVSGLTIVNANAALAGSPSLIGEVPAGGFPRNVTVAPNHTTLLVTNFWSGQLEAVDLHKLG